MVVLHAPHRGCSIRSQPMTRVPTAAGAAQRRRRLAVAMAATLAATVWAAVQDNDGASIPSAPPQQRRAPAARSETPGDSTAQWPEPVQPGGRAAWNEPPPQGLVAWGPPPSPPTPSALQAPSPEPAASAPPSPPDFPYTLIGRLDDGQARALLSNRTRSFGARVNDVIDGVWRVDAVDSDGVTLTWLPGSVTRTLAFPSS